MIYIGILELLNELNKSKYWFVKEMQCNYQSISKLMNNKSSDIKFDTIEKICDILKCEPSDFILLQKEKNMSKLLSKYNSLKKEDSECVYLFRAGIFYIALNDDAKLLNKKLELKITNLSPEIIKCGFPISSIEKYSQLMDSQKIKYKVMNNLPEKVDITDYLNNVEFKKIIKTIENVDPDNTTYKQAFDILCDIQQKLKTIK